MYYLARGLGASTLAQTIAAAITRQENINPAYNNPGGLIAAPGCTSRPGQIAICPDLETGQVAEENLVQKYIDGGSSLSSMLNAWAPAKCGGTLCIGNNPSAYAQNVSTWTGLDPTIPLNSLTDATGSGAGGTYEVSAPFDLASILPDFSNLDTSSWVPWAIAGLGLVGVVLVLRR
jgi:hypothetical protein